jgi:preprotein translocase subunit SecA
MLNFFKKLFGSKSDKDINEILPVVDEINEIYENLQSLSDEELKNKTVEFKNKIKEQTTNIENELDELNARLKLDIEPEERIEINDKITALKKDEKEIIEDVLSEILSEAFAVVKETCRRHLGKTWETAGTKITWDMVPFDVQLIGGIALHQGKIAEMATGEGKTLVAILPIYLNALSGKGCHLVTVNDYLARRDSEWMAPIFEFLGLTVACIDKTQPGTEQRRNAYLADIVYGTNNEFGFDYLRDNMVIDENELVQRVHNYAIVDEVDNILIDEARTPLIISGPVDVEDQKFDVLRPYIEKLVNAQKSLINKIVADAEALRNEGKDKEAGVLLLRGYRGYPKNKRLAKLFSEGDNKRLMNETEMEYLKEQARRLHEIDDELYFSIDEKSHIIDLTDKGRNYLSTLGQDKDFFILPDMGTEIHTIDNDELIEEKDKILKKDELTKLYAERSEKIHTAQQLLRAYALYEKDDEYVVTEDGKIMIVDEFTGRLLEGRRYSDGLHQAIEAKEGVKVQRDTQTLATITLQNYFRMYNKLAGMTGTAETESAELFDIYKLDVVVIPTNKEIKREDHDDKVYRTKREKYNAVLTEIEEMRAIKRPVLVGTTSVEVSELISRMLKRKGIPHNVLNAKQHQREAEIVQHAGMPGNITIATNMAGRGTDIKLGPGVVDCGGLHIVGTERHEARRIDRQLRGRAGRQGDPGSSRFFLCLEDDLMRLFGSERIANVMQRMGLKDGEVIQHPLITKSVERAQKKVEENNFAIRKRLLEYDNVMNQQREVVYKLRKKALKGESLRSSIYESLENFAEKIAVKYHKEGDLEAFRDDVRRNLMVDINLSLEEFSKLGEDGIAGEIVKRAREFYKRKEEQLGADMMAQLEKVGMLQIIDERWKEHLREMDDLKEGINLRAYGQKDPLIEYKSEAFQMFMEMQDMIDTNLLNFVFRVYPAVREEVSLKRSRPKRGGQVQTIHSSADGLGFKSDKPAASQDGNQESPIPEKRHKPVKVGEKVGRNDPCPCGSGKKYKNCHGS